MSARLCLCVAIASVLGLAEPAAALSFADGLAQHDMGPASPSPGRIKVPGASPAYYCDDPSDNMFQINRLDFIPTNPRVGFYQDVRLIGNFVADTGHVPWLNITGTINGRPEREALYYSALCDINVFQHVSLSIPGSDGEQALGMHRSCPPDIRKGYAIISSPPMPLLPYTTPIGKWDIRADATTQDGQRIFCVEGSFHVTD